MKRILSWLFALCVAAVLIPVNVAYAAEMVASGTCGENLAWNLTDDGTLTVSGAGAMADYASASESPWYSNRESVKKIVITDEVTSIGDRAFYNFTALTDVVIGNGVATVGTYAFRGCTALEEITIPANVTELKGSAFRVCTALAAVNFDGNAPIAGSYVFSDGSASLTIWYYEGSTGFDSAPYTDHTLKAMHVGEWVVDAEPTCTTDGSRHIDCAYCDETITEILPASHQYGPAL